MTRNEDKYPNPDIFMPERFIDEHGNPNDDDMMFASSFGFGRRSVLNPLLICLYFDSLLEFVPVDIWLLRL